MAKKFEESYQFAHPAEDVFQLGTLAQFWHYDNDKISIHPQSDVVALGGLVNMSLRLKGLPINSTCKVTKCVENKHVALEGSAANLGSTQLTFDLKEHESGITTVTYGLDYRINRLVRPFAEPILRRELPEVIDTFASQLFTQIDNALNTPEEQVLAQAA